MQHEMKSAELVREQVRAGYGRIAEAGAAPAAAGEVPASAGDARGEGGCCGTTSGCGTTSCCDTSAVGPTEFARGIGYEAGDLAALPDGANLGLSCGNPTAIARLKPGEVVLDLGSGGGFDCFIAGPKVGAAGRVIGVDMTAQMIDRARRNTAAYAERTGLSNVEFRLGEIEHLPIADGAVDVVISNCVLNLSPDKPQVWREISRVLRPGGRVAVSDLALLKPLPEAIRVMVEALVGCVAGAALVDETRRQMLAAGLVDIRLTPKGLGVKPATDWQDPPYRKIAAHLPAGTTPGDYITSMDVAARKPA